MTILSSHETQYTLSSATIPHPDGFVQTPRNDILSIPIERNARNIILMALHRETRGGVCITGTCTGSGGGPLPSLDSKAQMKYSDDMNVA